jgi:3-isopropylmalate dehydrogenase
MDKKEYKIAVLPGDGIGAEVVAEALEVLQTIARVRGFKVDTLFSDVGGAAIDKHNDPLPQDTLELCRSCDAVLLGAIGGPKWDDLPAGDRPERGLLDLRKGLGLFANLRPAKMFASMVEASSLKRELIEGIDILIVRELTGGVYFGEPRGVDYNEGSGYNTMIYTKTEVERIARIAFDAARKRRKKVTSVDKANVLEVSQYWRKVVNEIASEYPDVELEHMYVDNCAMQLVRYPRQFDVLLTGNMFGDILSDEAAMLTGSLGMLPSASLGSESALFEPVHGSAPDIAGQNKANPIATMASAAMMLDHCFGRSAEAKAIESAIDQVLTQGYRTQDIAESDSRIVTTQEIGRLVCEKVTAFLAN